MPFDPASSTWVAGACFGRIVGAVNGMIMALALRGQPPVFCLRDSVTNQQVVDVVMAWLRANPSKRDLSISGIILVALRDAFPCPATK